LDYFIFARRQKPRKQKKTITGNSQEKQIDKQTGNFHLRISIWLNKNKIFLIHVLLVAQQCGHSPLRAVFIADVVSLILTSLEITGRRYLVQLQQ
jgi:hypothetical protein